MGLPFRQIRKLWLLYLFLLFFAFFMFALSINIYVQSLYSSDLFKSKAESLKRGRTTATVVGHFVGFGSISDNLTREELDANNFSPIPHEGEMGAPVIIPARFSIKMQRAFKIHSYNLMASDRIALDRSLKDYRMETCKDVEYRVRILPDTSVIIVFHNEAWSVLMRTVWSVINRSPSHLLKEIILVDDASDRAFLKKPLEDYIATLPVKTTVYRQTTRQGIVPARLLGASKAKAEILTFLDAHCECSEGWLVPLLARIKENRKSVVCPVIDIISEDNFGYTKTLENNWGAFNWILNFKWYSSRPKEGYHPVTPIPTPGMAGGLFSIDRKYFKFIGTYDDEMKIWGGENIEMSFRVWQCGGSVEIIPCSHVGHVFRKTTPYTFPGGVNEVLTKNMARTAMVWMDKWQHFVLRYSNVDKTFIESLDVSKRLAFRKELECKSFQWYLENVWPDHCFPADDRFFGKIIWLTNGTKGVTSPYEKRLKSIAATVNPTNLTDIFAELDLEKHKDMAAMFKPEKEGCLRIHKEGRGTLNLAVSNCADDPELLNLFVMSPKGYIMGNDNLCLEHYGYNKTNNNNLSNVRVHPCINAKRQVWHYNLHTQQIIHQATQLCLAMKNHKVTLKDIVAETCIPNTFRQKWGLFSLPWKTY